jgi:aminoglycoside/choline kinase family phosphotransferase
MYTDLLSQILDTLEGKGEFGLELKALAADASTRSYFRAWDQSGQSFILMKMPADMLKSDEIMAGSAPSYPPFLDVGAFLQKGGLPVPDVLAVDLSRTAILLEDLGDQTLEAALGRGQDKAQLYRRAVELMVEMHAWAEKGPRDECVAFTREFDAKLLRWELEHFHEWLLVEYVKAPLSEAEIVELNSFYDELTAKLVALPKGFVHRDYQSRNLMLQGDRLRLIDFQDALIGPYVYDLVALLRDSYVSFDAAEVRALAQHFIDERAKHGMWCPELSELLHHFALQALQRKLKDAGRFVFIDRVRGNPKFLPNIPQSLKYVREALDQLPEFGPAREILLRYLP